MIELKKGNIEFIVLSALLLANSSRKEPPGIYVDHVSKPSICLNGVWKVANNPPVTLWSDTTPFDEWQDIQAPGECIMQGVPISHDKPFVYKTNVFIPEDYSGKNVFLQFDGVYSYARL